jgi:WD40 repeat protein
LRSHPGFDSEAAMSLRSCAAILVTIGFCISATQAQPAKEAPVGDANPIPVLEAGGPVAAITALAFSPDAKTLYVAGYDKIVRVYRRGDDNQFRLDDRATFRVPIGPGRDGVINVLAVSPDGQWVAASGLGLYRGASGFDRPGWIVSETTLTPEMRKERFTIWLFNTSSRAIGLLRGHEEDVLALEFAPPQQGQPQLLVSAGRKPGTTSGRVCVWDASRAAKLDDRGELVEVNARLHDWSFNDLAEVPGEPPPGLAVRLVDNGNYRVASAWADGQLRVREFGKRGTTPRNESVNEPRNADGKHAEFTQAILAVPNGLLTAGFVRGNGYVQKWNDAAGQAPTQDKFAAIAPPPGKTYALPRAMCLVSSGNGRGLDHAILVLRSPAQAGAGQEYRLGLLNIENMEIVQRPNGDTLLGTWTKPPVVVASPDGQFVAMTSDENRELRVISASSLFGPRVAASPIRSDGMSIGAAAFVVKNATKDVGLALRSTNNPIRSLAASDWILDAGSGQLSRATGDWQLNSATNSGWVVSLDSTGVFRWSAAIWSGSFRLLLEPGQAVTAFAIVPPPGPNTVPILAVATWDSRIGEPLLLLRNATTGKRLRQLNGHVQPIRSLSATSDGRLLVSAADDQTVSVWSMTDLSDIVGQHATLNGLTLRADDKSCVVTKVDADEPGTKGLRVDDAIESISFSAADRKPKTVTSPLEFFEALWAEKPGTDVQLNVRRNGQPQAVKVTLDQGIDERKPLATVFVSRDQQPQWIAWNPQGPYDVGARDAERFLGWHFNPAKSGEPVRFAKADAYRERLHKPGLLRSLLTNANLGDALRELDRPVSVPRPTIFCSIDGVDPVRFGGEATEQILIRQPKATLRMRIQGPSIAKNEVENISWRLNDGEWQTVSLNQAAGDSITQSLDLPKRGIARVQMRVRTREREPQQVTRDLVLRYQPPPPSIQLVGQTESRIVVRDPQFRLKAAVQPASAGQKAIVRLRQGDKSPQQKQLQIDETIALEPGENVLELTAANDGALAGFEEFETDRKTLVVVLQTKAAPQITFASLAEESPLAPPGAEIMLVPGRPIVTTARIVRIQGKIVGANPLTVAQIGDTPLTGFRPGAAAEFAFDQKVTLKPESQNFVFRSQTAGSPVVESQLTIVHRPSLPLLTLTDPVPDRVLTEGKDPLEVEVKGTITPPDGLPAEQLAPYQIVLRVMNVLPVPQSDGVETIIGSDKIGPDGTLAAKVRIQPGENRIDVILRNQWHDGSAIERRVLYRQPPKIIGAMKTSIAADKPFAELVADVESTSELTRVECNGREYPVNEVVKPVQDRSYLVTIPQVALSPGANTIRLSVANQVGPALDDGQATLNYQPPKPRSPAKVDVLNRPQNAVLDPQFQTRFAIQSDGSRIERIELRRGATVLKSITDPAQEAVGQENFRANGEIGPVELTEGADRLTLVAINGGGATAESFIVCYIPTPEWLEIDKPKSPQPDGEVTLTGRVNWVGANRAAEFEKKLLNMRVYVNSGFQQQIPTLKPAGDKSMEFTVHVILNRPKDNLVEVVCPDLRPESGGQQRFVIDCTQPKEEPRTLHLIVVAVDPARAKVTDKRLALRALQALQASGAAAGTAGLRSTVFQRVMMHPYTKEQPTQVVSGYVTCEHIRDALESIRRHSKPNDVAMIYWLGDEAVNENGYLYLATSETRPGRKLAHSAIGLREILEFPRETPGACALLLDTAGGPYPPDTPKSESLPSTRVAVMRYAWSTKTDAVPGLLMALEESAQKRPATSLQDLAGFAGQALQKFKTPPTWVDNLKELPALAQLVISKKPQ